MNLLFDGNNFRGYESEIEIIVKGYANDWASAITRKVNVTSNETLLHSRHKEIKTEDVVIYREKLINEGKKWLRNKYGFKSRWAMQMYAKFFYDKFFEFYPEYTKFKI
jgi:hypothetical protein